MVSNSGRQVVLLPIQPRFARLIMLGEKKVEFRKVRFRKPVSYVVVYASRPVQKILGYFEVSHVDEGSPQDLWERYSSAGGIIYEEFQAYYSHSTRGLAIGIGQVWALKEAIPLSMLGSSLRVPQSFMYLKARAFERILRYA
jgi:predicted transcriptional regulator